MIIQILYTYFIIILLCNNKLLYLSNFIFCNRKKNGSKTNKTTYLRKKTVQYMF